MEAPNRIICTSTVLVPVLLVSPSSTGKLLVIPARTGAVPVRYLYLLFSLVLVYPTVPCGCCGTSTLGFGQAAFAERGLLRLKGGGVCIFTGKRLETHTFWHVAAAHPVQFSIGHQSECPPMD
ncbi:hypothetical protein HOY82DRAFT_54298 [Tuber indicum]|nr:hypothetical protein HOY82DRAFT_54298 [Tuber indicum]